MMNGLLIKGAPKKQALKALAVGDLLKCLPGVAKEDNGVFISRKGGDIGRK
jgi:hypothetical protein